MKLLKAICLCVVALAGWSARADDLTAPYLLIENFSGTPLPSQGPIVCTVDATAARPGGIAAARIAYRLGPGDAERQARLDFAHEQYAVETPGRVRFWLRGDGSGNRVRLVFQHARIEIDRWNNRRRHEIRDAGASSVTLDFEEWREFEVDLARVDSSRAIWWDRIELELADTGDDPPVTEGAFLLDDMRLYPARGRAPPIARLFRMGPRERPFTTDVSYAVDLRNFETEPFRVIVNLKVTDHHRNTVAERTFDVLVPGPGRIEQTLDLGLENLAVFMPPFSIEGELFSPDNPDLGMRVDEHLVMGNSFYLFDAGGDVFGRWLQSGQPIPQRQHGGMSREAPIFGEQQRADARTQTAAHLSRTEAGPDAPAAVGPYALRFGFDGPAIIYTAEPRFLPGDAYRMGLWVRGDGSGARLRAIILDFAAPGGNFHTWNRSYADPLVCTLNFTDWRYFEFDLPGRGVGPRTPRGSTEAIDFPLELAGLYIEPAAGEEDAPEPPPRQGAAEIGAIYLQTQQHRADALSVQLAYDDAQHAYDPAHGMSVTVQNAWRPTSHRRVAAVWQMLDREGESVLRGRRELTLEAMEAETFRVDLSEAASTIAVRAGPFRLTVRVSEIDGPASAEAMLILARPDSRVQLADFERDRGYPGLSAYGAPSPASPAARTTAARARSGERSLALEWNRDQPLFATVEPPLPGIPTAVSLWVYGDNSGALFYPLIGDRQGVVSGLHQARWNLFLPRVTEGPLQNAVRIDWTGWRELTFRLPPIPTTWDDEFPIRPFVPNYPFAIHLAVVAPAEGDQASGTLYVDDITVDTHLAPTERLGIQIERDGESNVMPVGTDIAVTVTNHERPGPAAAARRARLSGGLYGAARTRLAGVDRELVLEPGARETLTLATDVETGAYRLQVRLEEDGERVGEQVGDLLAIDAQAVLGADWREALTDTDRLRAALEARFFPFEYDWDWVEHQRGNLLIDTLFNQLHGFRRRGLHPYVRLGYSAYWASGEGYKAVQDGRVPARWGHAAPAVRNWGHVVDIFHVPEDMDDWDNYMREMMRHGADGPVDGWLLWNSPDSTTSLAVAPEVFADMVRRARRWKDRYCPEIPLIVGGLSRETAIGYLAQLDEHGALALLDGVNLRVDAGRIAPEDGQILEYIEDLERALRTDEAESGEDTPARRILVTDLDWAVERDDQGLDAFDQAAYLARAGLLLAAAGAEHMLLLNNEDFTRLGLGLIYQEMLELPPMLEPLPAYRLKPAWWAMVRLRSLLDTLGPAREIEIQDRFPGLTRMLLYTRQADAAPVAMIWRLGEPGEVSFAGTGYTVRSAEGLMGERLDPVAEGVYRIGDMPAIFVLADADDAAAERLLVRGAAPERDAWPYVPLAAFAPGTDGARYDYAQEGGEAIELEGRDWLGRYRRLRGIHFPEGGVERFRVDASGDGDLILRKRYYLDEGGQSARVLVDGREHGVWNLVRSQLELAAGFREAVYRIEPGFVIGDAAAIELRYEQPANTFAWSAGTGWTGAIPLTRLGPLHADSSVASPRVARNIVGQPLRIGAQRFDDGIGVFARSFMEYPLNGQFSRFTAEVGIDAVTEGRGSVVFEVWADGEQRWTSGLITGLDAPRSIDLDITGVDRLRLLVDDGGDGNRYDVANWITPRLWLP